MEKKILTIAQDLRPEFYDAFHCIGGACRLNCCDDPWQILFSKKDYKKLRNASCSPELSARLEAGLRRVRDPAILESDLYGEFITESVDDKTHCPLHRADGLCAIQAELGAELLPDVCQRFPRNKFFKSTSYYELSLSPSCEVVLQRIWDLDHSLEFCSDPLPKPEQRAFTPPNHLIMLMFEIRSACIGILQCQSLTFKQRVMFLGLRLSKLRDDMSEREGLQWARETEAMLADPSIGAICAKLTPPLDDRSMALYLADCISKFHGLGLADRFEKQKAPLFFPLKRINAIESGEIEFFRQARQRLLKSYPNWDLFFENLAVSLFFYQNYPRLDSMEDCWECFVIFCNMLGLYSFVAPLACEQEAAPTKEELLDALVLVSRSTVHSAAKMDNLYKVIRESESTTLGHMAILLGP